MSAKKVVKKFMTKQKYHEHTVKFDSIAQKYITPSDKIFKH
jgi:hypothetical protein